VPKFPDFDKLWSSYPGGEAEDVKKRIGGAVNADWIVNTCTIRMSRAFNYAGTEWRIPYGHKYADQKGAPKVLNTVKGGDGLRYAFRVAEFLKYLKEKFGKPQIRIFKERGEGMPDAFAGRRGIVVFNDCGWNDATGHVDLWNKDSIAHEAYWEQAKEVYLWAADQVWQVAGSNAVRSGDTPIVTVRR
jgi:type VI secretion system (T6SS) effector Tae4 (amidase)